MSWRPVHLSAYLDRGEIRLQTGPFGTQLKASEYTAEGTPVINVRNLGYGDLRPDKLELVPDTVRDRLSRHTLEVNDIVFGRKGAVDRHLLVAESQVGWMQGSDCIRLRLETDKLHPRFLSYALRLPTHRQWMLTQCSNKATMASLNQDVIGRIPIRVPTERRLQDRIVEVLSAYDNLIENNRRRVQLLEESARLLYKEWFVHLRFPGHEHVKVIDGVPEGWKTVPIKEEIEGLYDGPHATPPAAEEGPIFLGIKNITSTGHLDLAKIRHISEHDFPRWTKRVTPEPGDIVFSYEATLNLYALVPEGFRGCLGRRLALVRPKPERRNRYFLFASFFEQPWRATIERNRLSGATVDRIPLAKFPEFPIVVPTDVLLETFDDYVSPMFSQVETLSNQNARLSRARDLLLPRLMNGELAA